MDKVYCRYCCGDWIWKIDLGKRKFCGRCGRLFDAVDNPPDLKMVLYKKQMDIKINELLIKFVTEINKANKKDDMDNVDYLINSYGQNILLMFEDFMRGLTIPLAVKQEGGRLSSHK